jgi:CHAD domain-containing protein/CYTH domain-containing protein
MASQDPATPPPLPADLLDRPAAETARILAAYQLGAATTARRRLGSPEDSEALHDLRVAIRRLRGVLQDWRRHTSDTVPGRHLRQLRRLTRATSPTRDAEVHLELVQRHAADLPAPAAPGLAWLRSHFAGIHQRAARQAAAAVEEGMLAVEGDLAARLERYRVDLDLREYRPQPGTPAVLASLIEEAVDRVERRLALVRTREDDEPAHRARIAAKRLRYLLEPFRRELPAARSIIAVLVALQDALGEHRDAAGLAAVIERLLSDGDGSTGPQADERAGLLALHSRLIEVSATAFETGTAMWTGSAVPQALAEARALAALLHRRGADREIEKKYLLHGLPELPADARIIEVEQGYLPGGALRERVRRSTCEGEVTCWRSIKAGRGISRIEVEEEISSAFFEQLFALTEGSRIRKRRFQVSHGGHIWEIDQFLDRDLILAEVELVAEDEAVPVPAWLAPWISREVTGEEAYLNSTLAW